MMHSSLFRGLSCALPRFSSIPVLYFGATNQFSQEGLARENWGRKLLVMIFADFLLKSTCPRKWTTWTVSQTTTLEKRKSTREKHSENSREHPEESTGAFF